MSIFNFVLKDQNDNEVNFADFKGKKVLLSFHPLAWTPICARQMQDLDGLYDQFIAKGITPFGVSVDNQFSKKPWAESLGLTKLTLLADFWPHGALAEALGCFIPKAGISGRSNFLIGPEGETIWMKRHEIKEQPDFKAILAEMP
ncbi:redoxin domain-containing protein [Deltaproteobacteria bacterium OttesenSCG-928-K17]|nr:redoxin domain-containing protein [Deltaproteobacteria bacterium OttesenSCG-928-K17]